MHRDIVNDNNVIKVRVGGPQRQQVGGGGGLSCVAHHALAGLQTCRSHYCRIEVTRALLGRHLPAAGWEPPAGALPSRTV